MTTDTDLDRAVAAADTLSHTALVEAAYETQMLNDESPDTADLTYVEISLPDGTVACWWVDLDDATTDALTNAVEGVIGSAHQIIC